MTNRVYYGEYTLKHWVDLILTKNIVLPEYQRCFVWDKEKSRALIRAFVDEQFVPPVTIGSYSINGEKINLILDGQQRLTSILLAYYNLFPSKENKVKEKDFYFANENDDQEEENEDEDFIEWDFKKLLEMIEKDHLREKAEIHEKGIACGYENMDLEIKEKQFESCFLGFSYIVPASEDDKDQQKFYSKVFRSINIEGKKLLPLESREALYYLNKDLVGLFSPEFAKKIPVNDGKMDFVRYLALLSQYTKSGKDKIARGYTKTMELYYEQFIYAVVDGEGTKEFCKLSEVIPALAYETRMEKLNKIVNGILIGTSYKSIIDIDLFMFGIVYHTIFLDEDIDDSRYNELKDKILEKIDEISTDRLHVKNPSALKHLKRRIEDSIEICKGFATT